VPYSLLGVSGPDTSYCWLVAGLGHLALITTPYTHLAGFDQDTSNVGWAWAPLPSRHPASFWQAMTKTRVLTQYDIFMAGYDQEESTVGWT
jgi:hypothetical protein